MDEYRLTESAVLEKFIWQFYFYLQHAKSSCKASGKSWLDAERKASKEFESTMKAGTGNSLH